MRHFWAPFIYALLPRISSTDLQSLKSFIQELLWKRSAAVELCLPGNWKVNLKKHLIKGTKSSSFPQTSWTKGSYCAKSTAHFELPSNPTTEPACRMHTVVSLRNKVEVYWCCCRITFEIASLFCALSSLPIFPCWCGGGVLVMGKVRMQSCLVDGGVGSFCCFSLPPLFVHSFCLQHHFWSQRGLTKRQSFLSWCLRSHPDSTVPLHIIQLYAQPCVCVL